jgi:hypothetical protein
VLADIVSLSAYESQVSELLDEEERVAMEFFIASGPEDHPIVAGTGGFRKARWARPGRGKSGGVRVIYFFMPQPGQIFMAAIYAKARKQTLSAADRNVLLKLSAEVKKAVRKENK